MGWSKYAEDNYEIIMERMREMEENRTDNQVSINHLMHVKSTPVDFTVQIRTYTKENLQNNNSDERKLRCIDCGQDFVFTVGEQKFFDSQGLQQPKRCHSCRKARRKTNERGFYNGLV